MHLATPVGRHPLLRARHRLIEGPALWIGQLRPVVIVAARVVPEPGLARLEALHDRMTRLGRVLAGVLHRGRVAAADVAALGAAAQVEPPAAGGFAFEAAGAARRHGRVDAGTGHDDSSTSRSGSRTRNRVSPGADSTDRSPWCLLTTMRHEMSRPSPVPCPAGLVVKNGSKIRPTTSSGMPGPVSAISTCSMSSTLLVRTVSVPSPSIACSALSIRLVQTWLSSAP